MFDYKSFMFGLCFAACQISVKSPVEDEQRREPATSCEARSIGGEWDRILSRINCECIVYREQDGVCGVSSACVTR